MKIDNYEIHNNKHKKLLGVTIDNKMKFEEHVSSLCTKASQKLHALSRVSAFMNVKQRRIIMKSFINSQFGYSGLQFCFWCVGEINNQGGEIFCEVSLGRRIIQ